MKKVWYKIARTTLCVCLLLTIVSGVFAVSAQAPAANGTVASKEEVIYANLLADGTPQSVFAVNALNVSQAGLIADYGNIGSAINMTNVNEVFVDHDGASVIADAGRFYYQANLQQAQLPWDVSVLYTLNGSTIAPQDLPGRDGALEIHLSIRQNPNADSFFFEHYMLQVSVTLDMEKCTNIVAKGATQANAGGNRLLTFTVMPKQSADIKISATVQNFTMEGISLTGIGSTIAIDTGAFDLSQFTDQFVELADGIAQLDDAAGSLQTGLDELYNGAKQLTDGARELATGVRTFVNGLVSMQSGIRTLANGVSGLSNGLGQLSQEGQALIAGAQQIANGMLSQTNAQLQASMGANAPTFTWDNYAQVLGDLSGVTPAMIQMAKDALAAQANVSGQDLDILIYLASLQTNAQTNPQAALAQAGNILQQVSQATSAGGALYQAQVALATAGNSPLAIDAVNAVLNGLVMANSGGLITDPAYVTPSMRQMAYEELVTSIKAGGATDEDAALLIIMACLDVATNGTDFEAAFASASTLAQTAAKVYAVQQAVSAGQAGAAIEAFLTNMVLLANGDSFEQAQMLLQSLAGLESFVSGVQQYVNGVSSVASGAKQLSGGLTQFANGFDELAKNGKTLASGMETYANGTDAYADGVNQFANGFDEFKDGFGKLRTEMNADSIEDKIQEEMEKAIDGLTGGGDFEVRSFQSPNNKWVEFVQFVLKTKSIQAPVEVIPPVEAPKLTLWDRFINLFKK